MPDPLFHDIVNEHRCTAAASGGRRCQLYRQHDEDIARACAWREPRGSD